MQDFPIHTVETAPAEARPILEGAGKAFGFVPNVLGVMAGAPGLLEAYTTLSDIFGKTSLSGEEQHTVLLTVSQQNGCTY